ncbi:hypothetical protein B0H10DRAFT_601326 [Mycena sp. CBHHK59/15]|nr:hypothetical protein B0H10DRAFT_601326 [Mycena sp. CBHHK59/15]
MSRLSGFAQRHRSLKRIAFYADGFWGKYNTDTPFASQFVDEIRSEGLTKAVQYQEFTLVRTTPLMSFGDREVSELDLSIVTSSGVSALRIASGLAPRLSSLILRMRPFGIRQSIHIDGLVSLLGRFPVLRTLHLYGTYQHLHFEGQTPGIVSKRITRQSKPVQKAVGCVEAHAAMRWFINRIAQGSPAIDVIHIEDEGKVRDPEHSPHRWKLEASYRIWPNRDLEVLGTPELWKDKCSPRCLLREPAKPAQTRKCQGAGVQSIH